MARVTVASADASKTVVANGATSSKFIPQPEGEIGCGIFISDEVRMSGSGKEYFASPFGAFYSKYAPKVGKVYLFTNIKLDESDNLFLRISEPTTEELCGFLKKCPLGTRLQVLGTLSHEYGITVADLKSEIGL